MISPINAIRLQKKQKKMYLCIIIAKTNDMLSEQILLKAEIPITAQRLLVLDFMLNSRKPLSKKDILSQLRTHMDRVTLYRIVNKFVECGILNKLSNDLGGVYSLKPMEGGVRPHLHFLCDKCHQTYCVKEVELNEVKLPDGFSFDSIEFLAHGICSSCNQ